MHLKLFLSTVLAVTASTGFCASSDFVGSSSPLTIEHTTEIPGDTLKAGAYSISIVEQIADRMIVRIDSTSNTSHAIFLGVPSATSKIGSGTGAVTWPTGVNKAPTLRGFVFPNGNVVEFVYPKAEAAALAKDNLAAVVAVDPRSEGRVALKSLSEDELRIVNLWLLSLTSAGPDNKTPAILARHYDATRDVQQPTVARTTATSYPLEARPASITAPEGTQHASSVRPITQARRSSATQPAPKALPTVAKLEEPAMPEALAHPAREIPVVAELPHTASILPMVWILGLISLLGAGILRLVAWSTGKQSN